MTDNVNFDALARKADQSGGSIEDLNNLFGSAFALEKWHFIARGALSDAAPYSASNAAYAGGRQMIRAFTETERLMRFARENDLTGADGSAAILSLPTDKIVDYLEQFIPHGVHGIWFNSDTASDGFFLPLGQLRAVKEHLARINWRAPRADQAADDQAVADQTIASQTGAPESSLETLIVVVKDALMLPSGFISEASYTCNFFCRVPADWTDGETLKPERLEELYRRVYGATWRDGNSDGSRYVVLDSFSKIFPPETARTTQWSGTENTKENHFWFYLADERGGIENVTADEFQASVDA